MSCRHYPPQQPLLGWAALLGLVLALTGCASVESKERIENLDRGLITYGKALRWGEYEEAALYRLPRDGRPVRSVNRDDFKDIRVTSYQVFEQRFNRAQTEAGVTMSISYYHEDTGTARTITDQQTWWYEPNQKRWFLDGDLPEFTR
ncbi:MAG: hypothetical protein M3255_01185 [Pseudomonadota bacterium]|nr:hypothetical protein [Pseudomonadota bacterium]